METWLVLALIIEAEAWLPLMEPTAVSISSQTCWRWSPKIDHRYCFSCVAVSSKNNANRGNRQAVRPADHNMEQITYLQINTKCGNFCCDETQRAELCKSQLWETFFLSLTALMFYSMRQQWHYDFTNREHINGIHFPWPLATLLCQQARLGASAHTEMHQKTGLLLPVYKLPILWANKWILMTTCSATRARLGPISWYRPQCAAAGKSAHLPLSACDTLRFTHTLAASNPVWNVVCDFYGAPLFH